MATSRQVHQWRRRSHHHSPALYTRTHFGAVLEYPRIQFRIALTMRFYIRQLRSLTSSVPGPLGVKPQKCWGHHFIEGGEGPFSSYAELSAYYAARLESARRRAEAMKKPTPDLTPFDNITPLVMTHHDLNERNIILGDDNQLCIIDWQHAGYYPEWFEYSGLMIWFGP